MKSSHLVLIFFLLITLTIADDHGHGGKGKKSELQLSYYSQSCPEVEQTVRDIIWSKVAANASLAAKILRIHYHDCFVRGCDASLLLDSTGNSTAEKDSIPNRSVSGYEIIDEIKTKLNNDCGNTVSCADIVALAARDAVSFQYQRPLWPVFLGRKDGKVSLDAEALTDLPSGNSNFTTLLKLFSRKGLDVPDLVTLSGAHTIGVSHCVSFQRRLFNFSGKGDTDPSLAPDYAKFLKTRCTVPPARSTTVEMDPDSSLAFDNHYYVNVAQRRGLFRSDAALLNDHRAAAMVYQFQKDDRKFLEKFAISVVKMGAMQVITGDDARGEIRKNCHFIN